MRERIVYFLQTKNPHLVGQAGVVGQNGAGDGFRTRDPKLGKLVLYQLSYARLM
jgi:hypothetical protein